MVVQQRRAETINTGMREKIATQKSTDHMERKTNTKTTDTVLTEVIDLDAIVPAKAMKIAVPAEDTILLVTETDIATAQQDLQVTITVEEDVAGQDLR